MHGNHLFVLLSIIDLSPYITWHDWFYLGKCTKGVNTKKMLSTSTTSYCDLFSILFSSRTLNHHFTLCSLLVSSTPTSTLSDHDRIPVVTSLPPAVDGHLRCFLRVSVPRIHWIVQKYPIDVQVRLRWWGEDGDGVLLR